MCSDCSSKALAQVLGLAALFFVGISGCQQKLSDRTLTFEDAVATSLTLADRHKLLKVRPEADSLDGNWIFIRSVGGVGQPAVDSYMWVIKFGKPEDSGILDAGGDPAEPQLVGYRAEDNRLFFEARVVSEDGRLASILFEGVRESNLVRGTFWVAGDTNGTPARLLATSANFFPLAAFPEGPRILPAEGRELFSAVTDKMSNVRDEKGSIEILRELLKVSRENPKNALSLDFFASAIASVSRWNPDDEELQQTIREYLDASKHWGHRMAAMAQMKVISQLSADGSRPALVLKQVEAAETTIPEEMKDYREALKAYRGVAEIDMQMKNATSEDAAVVDSAIAALQETYAKKKFETSTLSKLPQLLLMLAEHADRKKNVDQAIQYFTDIVALPSTEEEIVRVAKERHTTGEYVSPTERLGQLWKEKHGDDKELAGQIESRFQELLKDFTSNAGSIWQKQLDQLPAARRTALIEVFTGASCNPCIAADLVGAAMLELFPREKVNLIQFHQHIPGSDPLANQDSLDRFNFYANRLSSGQVGVPLTIVNGVSSPPIAGPLPVTVQALDVAVPLVATMTTQPIEAQLELKSTPIDGGFQISAEAKGMHESLRKDVRLRLAIVETEVRYRGPNRIARHDHVARMMIGGARGIPYKDGSLKTTFDLNVEKLRNQLQEYLKQYAAGKGEKIDAPPLPLERLALVAWVQHDRSMEIMQSATIPLSPTETTIRTAEVQFEEEPVDATAPANTQTRAKPAQEARPK